MPHKPAGSEYTYEILYKSVMTTPGTPEDIRLREYLGRQIGREEGAITDEELQRPVEGHDPLELLGSMIILSREDTPQSVTPTDMPKELSASKVPVEDRDYQERREGGYFEHVKDLSDEEADEEAIRFATQMTEIGADREGSIFDDNERLEKQQFTIAGLLDEAGVAENTFAKRIFVRRYLNQHGIPINDGVFEIDDYQFQALKNFVNPIRTLKGIGGKKK